MTRKTKMWQAVEQEHGKISRREALIALTAMEWADKTMIDKACEWLRSRNVLTEASIEGFRNVLEEEL